MKNSERKRSPKGAENSALRNSPVFKYIELAFGHFASIGEAIDEASLIRVCIAGRARNVVVAKEMIDHLVRNGLLEKHVDEKDGLISYTLAQDQEPTN